VNQSSQLCALRRIASPNADRFSILSHGHDDIFTFLSHSHRCNAVNGLICADASLRNYSLTHSHSPADLEKKLQYTVTIKDLITIQTRWYATAPSYNMALITSSIKWNKSLLTSNVWLHYFDCCSTFVQCLLVCVCVCVSVFLSVCYYFFSDCRIYLFSSLAARVFNKLTRYSLLVKYPCSKTQPCSRIDWSKLQCKTKILLKWCERF